MSHFNRNLSEAIPRLRFEVM